MSKNVWTIYTRHWLIISGEVTRTRLFFTHHSSLDRNWRGWGRERLKDKMNAMRREIGKWWSDRVFQPSLIIFLFLVIWTTPSSFNFVSQEASPSSVSFSNSPSFIFLHHFSLNCGNQSLLPPICSRMTAIKIQELSVIWERMREKERDERTTPPVSHDVNHISHSCSFLSILSKIPFLLLTLIPIEKVF